MSSSRLALDSLGRLICVVTVGGMSVHAGERFLVLDWLEMFEPVGRAPSARERESTRAPYNSTSRYHQQQRERADVPDEFLAEEEAVRLARLEQQRRPPDLISRAAA